jgi:CHAT domain-containing protein
MPCCAALLAIAVAVGQPEGHAFDILTRANRAVELDSVRMVETRWLRTLAERPGDRAALLGLSTLARLTYRFERADSLAKRLVGDDDATQPSPRAVDQYTVMGRVAIASALAGINPQRADSVLAQAQRDARTIGSARLESSVLVSLSQLRARSRGPRVGAALLRESRTRYPVATPSEESLRLCLEGSVATQLGDTASEGRLAKGVALARRSRSWRVYAECRVQLSQRLSQRGFFDDALKNLDTASVWLRRLRVDGALAGTLQRSAYVRFERGELSRARRDLEEAIERAQRARNTSVEAWSLQGLGEIGIALNDLTTAREYLDRAFAMHRAANDRWGMAQSRYLQSALAEAMGDATAARTALIETIDAYGQLGQPFSMVAPLRRLAQLELSQGRLDDADRAITRATQIATATRNYGWKAELPFHQAGLALARGQLDAADALLRSVERPDSLSGSLGYSYWIRVADVASRREDYGAAERAVQRAMRILAEWRDEFEDKDVRLRVAAARLPWGNVGQELPALVDRFAKAGRIAVAFALAESARARELTTIALQHAAVSADAGREAATLARLRKSTARITVADVQARLDDSTALIAYVAGRGNTPTTAFVVTRRTLTARALPPIDSIATRLDRYIRLASDGAEPSALARQLGDAVLNPVLASLAAGVTRLMIVPELSLFRVPFDALQLADGRYVVQRYSVSVIPSVTFAMNLTSSAVPLAGSLLAFGDALYGTTSSGTRSTAASTLDDVRSMPRLPFSGDEARRVARYSASSTVLVRGLATERALRTASLGRVRVLHLATHAIVDDRSLQRNALALTPGAGDDGRVGPDELSALRLHRALVVLSGCRTVGGVILGGEGLRGLTAPLLEAGAAAVVATQWPVGDASILPMVDRFYAHLATGASVATALRRAKLDALRDDVPPAVWAAFVLVGDGDLRVPLTPIRAALLPWSRTKTTSSP